MPKGFSLCSSFIFYVFLLYLWSFSQMPALSQVASSSGCSLSETDQFCECECNCANRTGYNVIVTHKNKRVGIGEKEIDKTIIPDHENDKPSGLDSCFVFNTTRKCEDLPLEKCVAPSLLQVGRGDAAAGKRGSVRRTQSHTGKDVSLGDSFEENFYSSVTDGCISRCSSSKGEKTNSCLCACHC